jgi:peptide/nickel transport system substrate-binding protein
VPLSVRKRLAFAAALSGVLAAPARAAEDREALMAAHRGGTLRLLASSAAGTLDPQVNRTAQFWQVFALAYDGLVAYRKVAGAAGREIVPDLADALPEVEEGGLLWRFRLRPGVRFSDGRPVQASDVAASLRRAFTVPGGSGGAFYGAILGAEACVAAPAACALEGVQADDALGTVAIRLARPDPEFLLKLALPTASVVPADSPARDAGLAPLPGTGPYRITEYDPTARLRLARNPQFREWSADAQPDGFVDAVEYAFGLEDEAEVTQVENDQADWLFDTPPQDRLEELGTRYAGRVHLDPAFALWYAPMNTRLLPFSDVRARRAVNLAVDRGAMVKLFGGPRLAEPLCGALPPGLPGYAPGCPYAPPDLARARRLVAESGTAGSRVTLVIDDSGVQRALGTYLQSVLRDLGYDARLRALSGSIQFTYIQNSANSVQISLTPWFSDYPAASDFLPLLFGCAAFQPGSDASTNISGFCDPALDAAMKAAGTDPEAWARADRIVTDAAPAAVLFAPRYIDVTSARVGHFVYHEAFHWLMAEAWVR